MMQRYLTFIAITLLCAGCSNAYDFPAPLVSATRSATDIWPDVDAIILEDVATLAYENRVLPHTGLQKQLVAVIDHRRRIKILAPEGTKAADIRLSTDAYTFVEHIIARSIDAQGRVLRMSNRVIVQEPRQDVPQAASASVYDVVFHIPEAAVGGVIEYRYKRVYTDPFLMPPWVFAAEMPILHAEFNLLVHPALKIDYRVGHGEKIINKPPLERQLANGQQRLVFVEKNVPAFYKESSMPHLSHVAPWVLIALRSYPHKITGPQTLASWRDFALYIAIMMEHVQTPPGVGDAISRFKQLRDALDPILLPGLGVLHPTLATDLWQGKPACSRDAAALLQSYLLGSPKMISKQDSIKPYLAFFISNASPVFEEGFPTLAPFYRVGVALDMHNNPNALTYLDPVCKYCNFGFLPAELSGAKVLVLQDDTSYWAQVPLDIPQRHASKTSASLALDTKGGLSGTYHADLTGNIAADIRLDISRHIAQGLQILTEALFHSTRATFQSSIHMKHENDLAQPFQIETYRQWPAIRQSYQQYFIPTVDLMGPALPTSWSATRHYPLITGGPRWFESVANIDIPLGYQVKLQPAVNIVTPFAEYSAHYILTNHTLKFSRLFVIKEHMIHQNSLQDLHDFVMQVQNAENDGPVVFLSN